MRNLIFAVLAASCAAAAPPPPAPPAADVPLTPRPRVECPEHPETSYAPALFACTSDTDCATAEHGLSRCGGYDVVGVNAASRAPFDAVESECRRAIQYATAHCHGLPTHVQSGRMVTAADRIVVRCVSGMCLTSSPD